MIVYKGAIMDKMYEITVVWPDGRTGTTDGYDRESATAMADLLWVLGADDVIVRCLCGNCETCTDRAAWGGQDA